MGDKTLHLGCGNVLSFSSSSLKKEGRTFPFQCLSRVTVSITLNERNDSVFHFSYK